MNAVKRAPHPRSPAKQQPAREVPVAGSKKPGASDLPAPVTLADAGSTTPVDPSPVWDLSFDCATKTFAFSIIRIDFDAQRRAECWAALSVILTETLAVKDMPRDRQAEAVSKLIKRARELDGRVRELVKLADGHVVDLFPGRADKTIHTVERIKALTAYVRSRVMPAVSRICGRSAPINVFVEYQMGPNAPARTIAAALITLFAEDAKYCPIIVGPSLKNMISFSEEGRYCHFVKRYQSRYCANKEHTRFNFALLEKTFGSSIAKVHPAALRGHIADSVMQSAGFRVHGTTRDAF